MTIQARTRTRAPAGPAGKPTATATADSSWMKTGASARAISTQELQRQREAQERRNSGLYMPFRFYAKAGEQREIILLDTHPGPCFFEHQLLNPRTNRWDIHETCPKEWEPCPLCDGVAGGKESYYVMMLSCIDLTPWVNKKGETVPHSKFLLPVKVQQHGFFLRQYERNAVFDPAGNYVSGSGLRGLHLLMARDNQQSASIGNPEFMEKHSEEEIIASFGHPAVVAQDGKVLKPENADCFPYEYAKLFPKPTAEALRKRYGGMAPAGSKQEATDEWADDTSTDGTADAIPMD